MSDRRSITTIGNHVYGLAAIAFGLIGLAWGDFAAVWQPVPDTVPHRTALAYFTAVCVLAAGLAMQSRRTIRPAAALLIAFYSLFAALWMHRVIGFPRMIGTWLGFAEEFVLVLAGIIAYAMSTLNNPSWSRPVSRMCQLLFGLCLLTFGLAHFMAIKDTAGMVPAWIPPSQRFWAIATGTAHLLAGVAIASGILASLASRLFTAMIIGFGILVWAPLLIAHPHDHFMWAGNAVNLAMIGAAWIVADAIHDARQS